MEQILALFGELPPSDYDHALTFPLFLCGCMTDNPLFQDIIKHRFQLINEQTGKTEYARSVMEGIWMKRAAASSQHGPHPNIDWREHLHEQWRNLLLL